MCKEVNNGRKFVTFLFAYVPNKSLYSIYNVNVERKEEFFEIKFFRFFNDFIIKSAGFIQDIPFLYFSVESMINGQKYIGLAHIEYSLLIFNIEENINNKLYYNYGNYFKDNGKLLYFSGNKQISFCPFIKIGDKCINNFDNDTFTISLNKDSNLYNNIKTTTCGNKNVLDYYCLDDCPNGFTNSEGICQYCLIDNNIFFYIGSRECKDKNHCHNESDSSTCYDCENSENDKIYYKYNCIHSCEQIHGQKKINETDGSEYCVSCKDLSTPDDSWYFSYNEHKCTKCENGIKNDEKNICIECRNNVYNKTLFFPDLNECVESCDKYYAANIDNISCEFCVNNTFLENGKCVNSCSINEGYGKDEIILEEKEIIKYEKLNICKFCKDNKDIEKQYVKDGYCSSICNPPYIIKNFDTNVCINCEEENQYFFTNEQSCINECPNYTQIINKTCSFCQENYYYDNDTNSCNAKCKDNQTTNIGIYIGRHNNYEYKYCENLNCSDNMHIINGKCSYCLGQYYSPFKDFCYKCFCGGNSDNYECNEKTGQCNCSDPYYGCNCEFYSENRTGDLKIISLNDRLIKTDKNYFTYKLGNNSILSNEYSFFWKLYFNDKEITNNKEHKKLFITETNETIFGINKEIFEEGGDNTIHIELTIKKDNIEYYYNKIKLILINSLEIDNDYKLTSNLYLIEMKDNATLKKEENKKYEGRYLFQYGILDNNNERLPLTSYINSESIEINLICSQGLYLYIKNDRDEIETNEIFKLYGLCNYQEFKIDDILNNDEYFLSEQLFMLMSFINNNKILEDDEINKIKEFINEIIPKVINKNGYFIESNTINQTISNKNITYLEPRSLFSLINKFAIKLNNNIDDFFEFFNKIFEYTFENNIISDKTLPDLDIKSLFRTIDNIYDICIENNLFFQDNSKFVEVLDNIALYLSYKTFPTETIRLIGNRISLLTYNLGEYQSQTNISFPYINSSDNVNIKDFSTYSFDNYNLNEKICSQKNGSLFCLTQDNYINLTQQLTNKYNNNNNFNISDFTLNIYLFQELNKNNTKVITNKNLGFDDENEKVLMKKNYSIIFKLIEKEKEKNFIIKDDDITLEFDIEFPFSQNLSENNVNEENNTNFINNYLKEINYNIALNPDNSNYTCIPKNYYKNKSYYCFTHFDYNNTKARCRCKTTINDEILIINDKEISMDIKDKQFKSEFKFNGLLFLCLLILLLLGPEIYFLFTDIIKDSKIINEKELLTNLEDETKEKYREAKKYCNLGVFRFSFYLSLRRFPYFILFNKYNSRYPRFIKHLIICIGFFIGLIFMLIPYYYISYKGREIIVNQRSIEYEDSSIKFRFSSNYIYLLLFFCFCLLGIFFGNFFIYIFSKILNFEEEETNKWFKIKIKCKNYIYYNVKSEVLLGPIWNKIKRRMLSFYYICGNHILNNKIKNNKFNEYLKHISRNYQIKDSIIPGLNDIDSIIPRKTGVSSINSDIEVNNGKNKDNKYDDNSKKEPLLIKSDENDLLKSNKDNDNDNQDEIIDTTKNKINKNTKIQICKLDNFILDKNNKYSKNKKQIEHFEKIRNKYIYVRKIKFDEIGSDDDDINEQLVYDISREINYSFYPYDIINFYEEKKDDKKKPNKIIINFILLLSFLLIIFIGLIIFTIYLVFKILIIFEEFVIIIWILSIVIFITIVNFILYYFKTLIGSILLFRLYHLRKKRMVYRCLFWVFVDKAMIHVYKVRNLITKYKREFDYL